MTKKFSILRDQMSPSSRLKSEAKKKEHLKNLRNLPSGRTVTKEDEGLIEEEVKDHRKKS